MSLDPDTGRRVCHGFLVSLPENMYASAPVIPPPSILLSYGLPVVYTRTRRTKAVVEFSVPFSKADPRAFEGPLAPPSAKGTRRYRPSTGTGSCPVAFATPRSPETAVPGDEVYVRPSLPRT